MRRLSHGTNHVANPIYPVFSLHSPLMLRCCSFFLSCSGESGHAFRTFSQLPILSALAGQRFSFPDFLQFKSATAQKPRGLSKHVIVRLLSSHGFLLPSVARYQACKRTCHRSSGASWCAVIASWFRAAAASTGACKQWASSDSRLEAVLLSIWSGAHASNGKLE